jgi:hypothetical protein
VQAVPETGRAVHDARRVASGTKQQNGKKTARPHARAGRIIRPHFTLLYNCFDGILHAFGRIPVLFAQPLDKAAQSGKNRCAATILADVLREKMCAFALLRTRTHVFDSFFTSGAFSWASFP